MKELNLGHNPIQWRIKMNTFVSVWIMVTALIEPGYPQRMIIFEGQDRSSGGTIFFNHEAECEEALMETFKENDAYKFRRLIKGELQAVRLEYLDVIQCVALRLPLKQANNLTNLPAENFFWKRK